jgi:hypothetical protein
MKASVLLALAVLILSTANLLAQQDVQVISQIDSPLKLIAGSCTASRTGGAAAGEAVVDCNLSVTNPSSTSVVAYTIYWRFSDPSSGKVAKNYTSKLALNPTKPPLLTPGKAMKHSSSLTLRPGAVSAALDFVLFDDGSYWGDDQSQTLSRIIAEVRTRKAVLQALRSKLDSQGVNKVKGDIDRELNDRSLDKLLSPHRLSQ